MRRPIVRLMMALKLASLGHGASGVRPRDRRPPRGACSRAASSRSSRAQGSVGRLRRPRAARPHGGRDDRRRRSPAWRASACRQRERLRAAASSRSSSDPRKGSRFSTARSSRPPSALAGCSRSSASSRPALSPARLSTDAARGVRRAVRCAHPCAARPPRPGRGGGGVRAPDRRQRHSRIASAGDDRVQDPYCLRCQPQVMGAVLDLLRQAAGCSSEWRRRCSA